MPKRIALLMLLAMSTMPAYADPTALVAAVYARAPAALLWSTQGKLTAQADQLLEVLANVASVGLRAEDYDAPPLAALAVQLHADSPQSDWSVYDHRLTRAAVQLIQHLHYGRIDPRAAGFELPEPRADLDVAATVVALASAPSVAGAVAAVEPQFYHYQLLKQALARYRALLADTAPNRLPAPGKRTLRAGDAYPGAPALRRLLIAEGDLAVAQSDAAAQSGAAAPADAAASDTRLDPDIVVGLQHYQDRHGLEPDGSLGAATFAALTTPVAVRIRQIELTLERWRWLPPFDTPPIIVNIPEFRLFAFSTTADRAASILQMPVIVGQAYADKRTPVFVGDLKYVVFRPYWDVPRSILVREMLPKIRVNPGYLAKEHLEIVAGESDEAGVLAPSAANIASLAAGQLRLRQLPGPDNALGLIKFIFPNVHDVFMHSTPARRLFSETRRAFSHGCIRVSDPGALAEFVLRSAASTWSRAEIDAAMAVGDNKRVALREPIHVMILYGTALATEAGPVQFFDDVYGLDRKLERLLGLPRLSRGTPAGD